MVHTSTTPKTSTISLSKDSIPGILKVHLKLKLCEAKPVRMGLSVNVYSPAAATEQNGWTLPGPIIIRACVYGVAVLLLSIATRDYIIKQYI